LITEILRQNLTVTVQIKMNKNYFSTKFPMTANVCKTRLSIWGSIRLKCEASDAGITWDGKLLSLSTEILDCSGLGRLAVSG
jgi:hypothetical protein